ncbi:unnamed protein product [Ilex paraguariensis]|uniref:Beta-galactosidase n=1 Tax=Ilex paraguariensis TaxID=185542 RepID=A0ABC8RE28_9AQUA
MTMVSFSRLVAYIIVLFSACLPAIAVEVSYDGRAIKIDGERRILISGSIHYPRSTPEMWPSLIQKAKDGGLNTIETYVFWNAHEPQRRQYDFSGNLDLIKFIKTIQNEGLYALLRIGPYVCAEWNYGTNNDAFMNEMKTFTTLIVDKVKQENLFASQGGPIILAQIENEYGNVIQSYGDDGKQYINWCADFAESLSIGVPWIMCQEGDAPQSMINTCNGWYCDQFTPSRHDVPKIWTENWTGWYKDWGGKDPHRTAEDLAFAVGRFYQYGGTLQNYYMYHGGTNFGRTSGGPYIATTYDYDAPLDEYGTKTEAKIFVISLFILNVLIRSVLGNLNQPKWGHLKQLHLLLISMEKILTHGEVTNHDYGKMMSSTVYDLNGTRVCFFGNANEKEDIQITFEGTNYTVPAWSVSILPNCSKEVYNTARVNSQTSVMAKKPYAQKLEWTWRAEQFEHFKSPSQKQSSPLKGVTYATHLLDQKALTNDTSDYLWYTTSVDIDENSPVYGQEASLEVQSKGHILHAFVNARHIGSKWAKDGHYDLYFERSAKLKLRHGKNSISLLSATVGLQNYGAYFDKEENGILGPVKLIAPNSQELDLSTNQWEFKVGLNGEERELYKDDDHRNWHTDKLPFNRMFVWYKTTFQSPPGEDPVVLDLLGLGKGIAWVNGHNIGRYWPSYHADENGCSSTCDYRGAYTNNKCLTNCGQPSQRWYHVPRSFLQKEGNTLVLFEEFGGNPSNVNVQTVTVGKAYGNAYEGNNLELSCQGGRVISEIKFASFGDPKGTYGSFEKGSCESPNSLSVIKQACVGKESCSIDVSEGIFEPSGCKDLTARLAVEALC